MPASTPILTRKKIGQYCYDKLTGTFMGFLIGMSATSLVAQFFETKSIRNLWGLTAKKTIVDKNTFAYLEWFISLVIVFIVFEIFTNYIKIYLDKQLPLLKIQLLRWAIKHDLPGMSKNARLLLNRKSVSMFAAMQHGTKAALDKFSKK